MEEMHGTRDRGTAQRPRGLSTCAPAQKPFKPCPLGFYRGFTAKVRLMRSLVTGDWLDLQPLSPPQRTGVGAGSSVPLITWLASLTTSPALRCTQPGTLDPRKDLQTMTSLAGFSPGLCRPSHASFHLPNNHWGSDFPSYLQCLPLCRSLLASLPIYIPSMETWDPKWKDKQAEANWS